MTRVFLACALFAPAACMACYDPDNRFCAGVAFTAGEVVDVAGIMHLGSDGVNYFSECGGFAPIGDSVKTVSAPVDPAAPGCSPACIDTAYVAYGTQFMTVTYTASCNMRFNLFAMDRMEPASELQIKLFLQGVDPCDGPPAEITELCDTI